MTLQRSGRVLRMVVGVLASAGVVGGVLTGGAELLAWRQDLGLHEGVTAGAAEISRLLAIPSYALLALLIVWRATPSLGSLFGGLFLAAYGLWGLAIGPLTDARPLQWVAWATLADWISHSAAVRFTQVFPARLQPDQLLRPGAGPIEAALHRFYAVLLRPRVFWPFALGVEVVVRIVSNPGLYVAHVIGVCALAAGYLFASYRAGSRDDRQRIFWLMEGAVVFLTLELALVAMRVMSALGIVALAPVYWAPWLNIAETWLPLLCFALAIFYRGAFDSGMILRRTTVASASTVLGILLFITLETAVSETIEGALGFQSQTGTIVAGVVVALLLRPIASRIDRWLARANAAENPSAAAP